MKKIFFYLFDFTSLFAWTLLIFLARCVLTTYSDSTHKTKLKRAPRYHQAHGLCTAFVRHECAIFSTQTLLLNVRPNSKEPKIHTISSWPLYETCMEELTRLLLPASTISNTRRRPLLRSFGCSGWRKQFNADSSDKVLVWNTRTKSPNITQ